MRAGPLLATVIVMVVAAGNARAQSPLEAQAETGIDAAAEAAAADSADDDLPSDPCVESFECRRNGRCVTESAVCVARSADVCAASEACREDGVRCELDADAGRCVSRLGRKVDPATTRKVAPPPGNEPAPARDGSAVRAAGAVLAVLGGLGLGVGVVSACLWEVAPEGGLKQSFMIATLSSTLPGVALSIPGVVMLSQPGDTPVYATVGPGALRVTF